MSILENLTLILLKLSNKIKIKKILLCLVIKMRQCDKIKKMFFNSKQHLNYSWGTPHTLLKKSFQKSIGKEMGRKKKKKKKAILSLITSMKVYNFNATWSAA